ncbi:MAG: hypothetical protein KAH32_04335 [Chlamydiia bacterium]|nr:hypothetical protein [Chlamydiia bacterium]
MTATISKGGLTVPPGSPFVGIEITGYKTADQVKMDGITVEMVKKAITDKIGIGAGQKIPNKPND